MEYALAERGASVTVYERGVPGNGQSGGESHIFRHAHDDPRLVAFARAALGDGLTPTLSPQSKLGADVFRAAGG
jgi:glycine/D-amino acid oxidase-like deaminating enzyme